MHILGCVHNSGDLMTFLILYNLDSSLYIYLTNLLFVQGKISKVNEVLLKFEKNIWQWMQEIEKGFFTHAMGEVNAMGMISKDNSAETICLALYKYLVANYDHVQWSCVATRSQPGKPLYATVKKRGDHDWVREWRLNIKKEWHTGGGMGAGAVYETWSPNDRDVMVYVC